MARVKPEVIVSLGSTALKSLLQDSTAPLQAMLGTPFQHQGRWVIAVYHPSYVLRAPDEASRRQAYVVMVEGLREAVSLLGAKQFFLPGPYM
ncbi:uracil-DNA glycosylase family protein [Janthinobacterium sp. Mn2066]|uniref:uracil-DNA glycosylase family protein n=1 Tax=Janthinobacterium sp. Mn2066 TaxID=3395264 RepID=UPI003BCFA339